MAQQVERWPRVRSVFKGGTVGCLATEDQGNPGQVLERP